MINTGGKFGGMKAPEHRGKPPALQKGSRIFTVIPESEEEYTLSIQGIDFDDDTTFAFTVSLFHQAHELFLVEDPVITGMNQEAQSINVRLKVKNTGKGAFEVKLFYTAFGG